MIDRKVFTESMVELQAHFDRKLTDTSFKMYLAILSQELTTEEFKKGVIWAYRHLKPHPSFFPSPQEIIAATQGSLDDRALIDWTNAVSNTESLSMIGRKALQAIGGSSTVRLSENPSFLKKDFIAVYKAFAVDAAPNELRSQEPQKLKQSEPALELVTSSIPQHLWEIREKQSA